MKIIYKKSPSVKCQRAGNGQAPRQDEFRNFCMSDETKKVYHQLEETIEVC
jgi:hypothetical protein